MIPSFRLKTVLGIALIETVLLVILVWSSLQHLRSTGEDQLRQRAETTATLFATTTANAVLAFDLASLESFVEEVLKNPGLVYARVRGGGQVLAESGDAAALDRPFLIDTAVHAVTDGVFDTAADISIAGETYGRVELGLDVAQLQHQLVDAKRSFMTIALAELLLSALFSLALGALLTTQLRALMRGTEAVGEGRYGYQVQARGSDEIAQAVRAFNQMSSGLARLMNENAVQQEALEQSRDMLAGLVDNLHAGILLVDRDALVSHANHPFRTLFHISPLIGDLRGKRFEALLDTMVEQFAHPRAVQFRFDAVIAEGKAQTNMAFELRDGRHIEVDYRPLDTHGERQAHLWDFRDVTARVRAQQQVQERRRQLDTVFDLSPDGFVYFDGQGLVTSVNPAFTHMTGIDAETVTGTHRHRFLGLMRSRCGITDIDDSGGQRLIRTSVPKPRALAISERSLQDSSGIHVAAVMYLRDVTHERELDQMKSDFLATAAHELRTPLSSVYGFAELLLHFEHDDETRAEMLTTIHQQSAHLVHMLNELLDLARIEARAGKDFEIRHQPLLPLIRAATDGFIAAGDDRRPLVDLPDTLPTVAVDADKLQQLLHNLLSNAFKYSLSGGPVSVTACVSEAAVEIRVADQGIGMTAEQCEQVFDRFYRADKSGAIPGSGLGMSLVREIASIHGWSVSVESALGQGTTVTVSIPAGRNDGETPVGALASG